MNYYAPLERADHRWDFTCTNDGRSRPAGYCAPFREWSDEMVRMTGIPKTDPNILEAASFAAKHHGDGHATKEEAVACYRNYQLDQKLRFSTASNTQHKCKVCGEWTSRFAEVDHLGMLFLCDTHCNRNEVGKLWEGSDYIASSW